MNVVGISFKSAAASFTAPVVPTLVAYSLPTLATLATCAPTCSPTITSTGAGHLLIVNEGDSNSGGPTMAITGFTAPAGCHKTGATGGFTMNCAYLLSSTASATSIAVAMSGNTTSAFSISEWSCPSGTWHFDNAAATVNAGSATFLPAGQAIATAQDNELVDQMIIASGGVDGATFYPMPLGNGPNGTVLSSGNTTYSNAFLPNAGPSGSAPVPAWPFPGVTTTTSTSVFGAGFYCQ
jgi:hypothetical protein